MTNTLTLLAATSLALVACGDNKSRPDAATRRDARPDAPYCQTCPAAPAIGTTQLDRMGRPAINTALIGTFTSLEATKKDAYNANADRSTWQAMHLGEMAQNLAVFDSLDETCGTQVGFSSTGTTNAMAYGTLAGLLADDRLYLDTSKGTCAHYLAVEFGVVTAMPNQTCGGRAPSYDVIDTTYTALAVGTGGFSTDGNFTPAVGDGVPVHTDLLATFPYLGAPH